MSDTTDTARAVVIEREFAHPPEKLWRALTQPHLIAEWLMRNDFAPVVGHRFQLNGDWGGTLACEVREVEPGATLSYTWDHVNDDPAFDVRSVVVFTLAATATGTRLRVEQTGFRPEQKQASGGARYGWTQFLGKLDKLLARID